MHLLYFAAAALLLIVQVSASLEMIVYPTVPTRCSVGDRAVFQCHIHRSGRGTTSLKWRFKAQAITSKSGRLAVQDLFYISILRITDVRQTDAGYYMCETTDSMSGEVILKAGILIVSEDKGLRIKSETEQYGKAGTTGTVMCEVSGAAPIHVFWSFRNRAIIMGQKYTTLKDRLIIRNLEATDEGTYTCRTFQPETGAIETLNINYHVPGSLVIQSKTKQQGKLETTGTVRCEASGDPPIYFFWSFGKKLITPGSKYTMQEDKLLIRNITMADKGMYTCQAFQPQFGTLETLKITYAIGGNEKPYENVQYGNIGTTRDIDCHYSGAYPVNLLWTFRNRTIKFGSKYVNLGQTLRITNLQHSDAGTYTCHYFQNQFGFLEIVNVELRVTEPLSLRAEKDQYGKVGTTGTIMCEASGALPIELSWGFIWGEVRAGSKYTKLKDRLIIQDVQKKDGGTYTCQAFQPKMGTIKSLKISYHVSEKGA